MEKTGQIVNLSMKLLNEMEGKARITIPFKGAELKTRLDKNYDIIPPERNYWGIEIADLIANYLKDEYEEYGNYIGKLVPAKYWMGTDGIHAASARDLASKFYIAVKELIIEWEDSQSEFAGYIHCDACFEADNLDVEPVWLTTHCETNEEYVKLAHFVKEPGRKITFLKIEKSEMQFFPLKLWPIVSDIKCHDVTGTETNRKHCPLEVEIRSFFDEHEILPIKNACITVEIIVK